MKETGLSRERLPKNYDIFNLIKPMMISIYLQRDAHTQTHLILP
jgi:hypothetical protein